MREVSAVLLGAFILVASALIPNVPRVRAADLGQDSQPESFQQFQGRTLLDRYCVTCHNQKLKTAGLRLDNIDSEHVAEAAELWEKVVRKLRTGSMPPAGAPRPDKT